MSRVMYDGCGATSSIGRQYAEGILGLTARQHWHESLGRDPGAAARGLFSLSRLLLVAVSFPTVSPVKPFQFLQSSFET